MTDNVCKFLNTRVLKTDQAEQITGATNLSLYHFLDLKQQNIRL